MPQQPAKTINTSIRSTDKRFSTRAKWICALTVCACLVQADLAQSAERRPGEPGWMSVVVATGDLQKQIEATPIEKRPYRPFHFYGNTVRRMHYRGTPFPRFGEVVATPFRALSPR